MSRVSRFRAALAGLLDADRLVGATCSEIGPELWFPNQAQHGREERQAAALCKTCPVRKECLRIALDSDYMITEYGVWAGYTKGSLRRMRRLRQALAGAPLKPYVPPFSKSAPEGVTDVAA